MRWIAVLTLFATLGMGASAFACDGGKNKKDAPKTTTQTDTNTSKTTTTTGK